MAKILEALRNTCTVEGAKRAIQQVEAVYESEIEGSFYEPQILAELQRLRQLSEQDSAEAKARLRRF